MILSGLQIENRLDDDIVIDPYDPQQLNPNSVNLTLHDELMTYEEVVDDLLIHRRAHRHVRGLAVRELEGVLG